MNFKNAAAFFPGITWEMCYKDAGMIMVYLRKLYDTHCVYVNYEEKNLHFESFRGVENVKVRKPADGLSRLSLGMTTKNLRNYIRDNAASIDLIVLYHVHSINSVIAREYKKINPGGRVLLKLDMSGEVYSRYRLWNQRKLFDKSNRSLKEHLLHLRNSFFHLKHFRRLIDLSDYIVIETSAMFDTLQTGGLFGRDVSGKLIHMPNGADEFGIEETGIKLKTFQEKENLILNIGRIGDPNKNCEMLAEAASMLDLRDWKIVFIGEVYPEFQGYYDKLVLDNPALKDKIVLTGAIRDKKTLYEYYNRAKVFTMTSYRESFGIVLVEALHFGNYIIATDTGAARDVTSGGTIGRIIPPGDTDALARELAKVISGETPFDEKFRRSTELSREKFNWEKIVLNSMKEIDKIEARRGTKV